MRFMGLLKADEAVRGGRPPDQGAPGGDGEVHRGAGEGRRDARDRGAPAELEGRARPSLGGKPTVIDGPFTESKELIAGYGSSR